MNDMSEYWISDTVSATETLDLGGVDEIAAICQCWTRAFAGVRADEGGQKRSLDRHASWGNEGGILLGGRTMDLRAAYKQWAVAPSDHSSSVIAVWNVEEARCDYFVSVAHLAARIKCARSCPTRENVGAHKINPFLSALFHAAP